MTIIRDINGNRLKFKLGHYLSHAVNTDQWHEDSTGLYCIDYAGAFCAFIRPENKAEHNAVGLAKRIGKPRP